MQRVFIGIGSNVGDRQAHIDLARRRLGEMRSTTLVGFSSVYETAPVGPVEQGAYLNAAAQLETELAPHELLDALAAIEVEAGRPPRDERIKWGPRTLDLDILLYGDHVMSDDNLAIPHPMMHDRDFVLRPLAELDPGAVHPLLQMTVGALLKYRQQQPDD